MIISSNFSRDAEKAENSSAILYALIRHLNGSAPKSNQEVEALMALAMIAHIESNDKDKEVYLQKLTKQQSKQVSPDFFKDSDQNSIISQALLSCSQLSSDIRGINAFIHAYSEVINQTLNQKLSKVP